MYNWQDFKCRCSAITQMMSNASGQAPLSENQIARIKDLESKQKRTEKQESELTELVLRRDRPSSEIVLGDTCIGYLMQHYAWVTQKMVSVSTEMDIDYLNKGKIQEKDGIALLSIADGVEYSKYEGERIHNGYLTGLPDIFLGEEIYKATKITDLKNIWDYPGFLKKINSKIEPCNQVQIQGYMDISGANEGEVAEVLTDMPETIINDYRRRLFYKMQNLGTAVTDESPAYISACEEMERSMRFEGKIPRHQRVFKKPVTPFESFYRQKVYDKVKVCREWLEKFDLMYQKLNK